MSAPRAEDPLDGPAARVHDWTAAGAWTVGVGVHRIPLPTPVRGMAVVNVYAVESDEGLTLIDGGWASSEARDALLRALVSFGYSFDDIRMFLVTHAHHDHYTLARRLGDEFGAPVLVGRGDEPAVNTLGGGREAHHALFNEQLRRAGCPPELRGAWTAQPEAFDGAPWNPPDEWLDPDSVFEAGGRQITAVPTPGHTPGHHVFVDETAGIVFSGDHLLPTVTPSVGLAVPAPANPLADFMESLRLFEALPDLEVLPGHGDVGSSSRARARELLDFHDGRLERFRVLLSTQPKSSFDVANQSRWTRARRPFADLNVDAQVMAVIETKAHLDLLASQGLAQCHDTEVDVAFTWGG